MSEERIIIKSRRMAQFSVTKELLEQSLALPDGTQLRNITRHPKIPGQFIMFIEHSDFPEMNEGAMPIDLAPKISADFSKRPGTWLTFDFGEIPE